MPLFLLKIVCIVFNKLKDKLMTIILTWSIL
jgi:hypothetical protein